MDFRSLTVKELFDNPATAAVIKEDAPQLLKYPIKMFNKKKCGEIFDKVVAAGIVPKDTAEKVEAKINALLLASYMLCNGSVSQPQSMRSTPHRSAPDIVRC